MATLKDIAKLAEVSIASVSKVLNGNYTGIGEKTKERIFEAAKNLNYRPNRIARGLVKNKTTIIGLVVPDIANPYYADLAKGVEEQAELSGYNVILCNTNDDAIKERKYVHMLTEYNIDGVILVGVESYDPPSMKLLQDLSVPFVSIDRTMADAPVSFNSNGQRGAFLSTEHLIQFGHKKIAFIGGVSDAGSLHARYEGYLSALMTYSLPLNKDLVKVGSYTMETGYRSTLALVEQQADFTAIVCANDLIVFGAIKALRENGLDVPRHISLIGFDDIVLSSFFEPKITTIKQDTYKLGKDVVQALLSVISKEETNRIIRLVEPELIVRDSVRLLV